MGGLEEGMNGHKPMKKVKTDQNVCTFYLLVVNKQLTTMVHECIITSMAESNQDNVVLINESVERSQASFWLKTHPE